MLSTKRLLLCLLVLGVLSMHGLVTSSGTTASHHGIAATTSASTSAFQAAAQAVVRTSAQAAPTPHDHATSAAPSADVDENEGDASTALALCMALLLALGVTAFAGRRTTWVADLAIRVARIPLPRPPVLRDRTPVPRFTVMRC